MRRFFKTVFVLTVLSKDEPVDGMGLDGVARAILDGGCSGEVKCAGTQEMTGRQAAQALKAQGSEPGFFRLDEEGNDIEQALSGDEPQCSTSPQRAGANRRTVEELTEARRKAADSAFEQHDFEGLNVCGCDGWEHSEPGNAWTRRFYAENRSGPSTRMTFAVEFEEGTDRVESADCSRCAG